MDKRLDDFLEGQLKKEATPPNIAEEMVALIPDDVIQNIKSTYLDINCKTGVLLIKIRDRIMKECKELIEMYPNPKERRKYIDDNMLYGISWVEAYAERSRVNIYGKVTVKGNVYYVPEVGDKAKKEPAYKTLIKTKDNGKLLNDTIKEICKMQFKKDMSFDVVIGNPPYNRGMDIDFVFKAFELCTKYVIMITPAKCFTAEANQSIASKHNYGDFRKDLVPHMSHVVFYPCCKDVFDILQVDGITYYLLDKNSVYEKCTVKNVCKHIKEFDNSVEERSITERQSLVNVGNEIIEYLGEYKVFNIPNTYHRKKYQVWTNTQTPGGNLSTVISPRKTLFIGESTIEEDFGLELERSNAEICSFTSDNIDECRSFVSWLNCKFTRFFTAINQSKLTGVITNDCFRFVPAPPSDKFDHIYTDEELYEAFGLNKSEAQTKAGVRYKDIIEAVVKERN